jgi:hypothetical protein
MDGFLVIAFGLLGLLLPLGFIQLFWYYHDRKNK